MLPLEMLSYVDLVKRYLLILADLLAQDLSKQYVGEAMRQPGKWELVGRPNGRWYQSHLVEVSLKIWVERSLRTTNMFSSGCLGDTW